MQNGNILLVDPIRHIRFSEVPGAVQLIAYLFGVELAITSVAGWGDVIDTTTATWSFCLLVLGFVISITPRVRTNTTNSMASELPLDVSTHAAKTQRPVVLAFVVACTSLWMSFVTAKEFDMSPLCFHDEYSYLFQAETFLSGRLYFSSHSSMPDLFDQMHVLNEGKFASRYFPGTALWIAPFVALGHPLWGHWFAGVLIAITVFATGRELAGNICGFVAGMVTALSPGMAIFSNLLLSSHPTALGLMLFVFSVFRTLTSQSWRWALLGGTALAFAVLCRPLTALGVSAPFGVAIAVSIGRGFGYRERMWLSASAVLPVAAAALALVSYNYAIVGKAWKSPWQLYNEIYTPRHCYGFNNAIRGDLSQGPKIIEGYDKWAQNLTVERAVENVTTRGVQTWRWSVGAVPFAMATVVVLIYPGLHYAGWLVFAGVVGLHAAYFPYWYEGTLGFHYVFETIPLWALIYGMATAQLWRTWWRQRSYALCPWWASLALIGLAATYLPIHGEESVFTREIGKMIAHRAKHARFLQLIDRKVTDRPALVLLDQGLVGSFIVNSPGLNGPVIFGRYRATVHTIDEIARAFPERALYLFREDAWDVQRFVLSSTRSAD